MSDVQHCSTDTETLTRRLGNAEKSIVFIQQTHAETLAHLHEEMAKWQQKCSDLSFQLAINGPGSQTSDDCKSSVELNAQLWRQVEEYESQLRECKKQIEALNRLVEEKEQLRQEYETRLTISDRQHALQLNAQYTQKRALRNELEQRSLLIAQLTTRLHREKQQQQNLNTRVRLGQMVLSDKSLKFKAPQEELTSKSQTRFYGRSLSVASRTSLSHDSSKVLFIGRRPPTPPQQLRPPSSKSIESMDEHLHGSRSRPMFNDPSENGNAKKMASLRRETKLPPIIHRKIVIRPLVTTVHHQEEKP